MNGIFHPANRAKQWTVSARRVKISYVAQELDLMVDIVSFVLDCVTKAVCWVKKQSCHEPSPDLALSLSTCLAFFLVLCYHRFHLSIRQFSKILELV